VDTGHRVSGLRQVAEHEAAHAVVAAHFGSRVREVVIQSADRGYTLHGLVTDPEQAAAITVAGDVYNRQLGSVPYRDLACADLAAFERTHGLGKLWAAERAALEVLTFRRAAVIALADRLVREGAITFDR
jgi:hypothetical protein